MKIPKCPRTITGNHRWRGDWQMTECFFCGLIDDRPQPKIEETQYNGSGGGAPGHSKVKSHPRGEKKV